MECVKAPFEISKQLSGQVLQLNRSEARGGKQTKKEADPYKMCNEFHTFAGIMKDDNLIKIKIY